MMGGRTWEDKGWRVAGLPSCWDAEGMPKDPVLTIIKHLILEPRDGDPMIN